MAYVISPIPICRQGIYRISQHGLNISCQSQFAVLAKDKTLLILSQVRSAVAVVHCARAEMMCKSATRSRVQLATAHWPFGLNKHYPSDGGEVEICLKISIVVLSKWTKYVENIEYVQKFFFLFSLLFERSRINHISQYACRLTFVTPAWAWLGHGMAHGNPTAQSSQFKYEKSSNSLLTHFWSHTLYIKTVQSKHSFSYIITQKQQTYT